MTSNLISRDWWRLRLGIPVAVWLDEICGQALPLPSLIKGVLHHHAVTFSRRKGALFNASAPTWSGNSTLFFSVHKQFTGIVQQPKRCPSENVHTNYQEKTKQKTKNKNYFKNLLEKIAWKRKDLLCIWFILNIIFRKKKLWSQSQFTFTILCGKKWSK